MIKKIDWYVASELLQPFLFGLAFFVSLFLIDLMMELSGLIFSKGVPSLVVLLLFLYNLPPILVISFPMAILFGNLVAFGRLASDSEITALKAGGFSFTRIVFPAFLVGFFITGLCFFFNEKIVPVTNEKFIRLFKNEVTFKRPLPKIASGRFFEAGAKNKFYVSEYNSVKREMSGVIMYESQTKDFPRVIEAKKAIMERGKCTFYDGRVSQFRSSGNDRNYTYFEKMEYPLSEYIIDPGSFQNIKNSRQMNCAELYAKIQEDRQKATPEKFQIQDWIELWAKISIPFACVVFMLVGAPLGAQATRSGAGIGVGLSVVIILVYYVLFAAGKAFAGGGYVTPFLGVWLSNIIIGSIGFALIYRAKA